MAIVAQAGIFGFAPQSAKETQATQYYKHRAQDIDLAVVSDDRIGPQEVGGTPTPTLAYRAGVMAGGGATISPRLENTFGWLLMGAAGDVTTTADENVFGTVTTGFNHHIFAFDTTSEGFVPWMTFYKEIPGLTSTERLAEHYVDSKIVGLNLALPNDGLIQSRVDVISRMATGTQFEKNPSTTFINTQFEDFDSVPLGSIEGSYVQIPEYEAADLPVVACNVAIANAPLDMRQEKIFGSPYLEDVTIINRSLTVDMVVKWQDPDLYLSILTGSTTGTQWSACPWIGDLDVYAVTGQCEGEAYPWQLRVQVPQIMYQLVGGITLAGNQAVMARIRGTAIKGTQSYYDIHLANATTQYVWPT